MPQEPTYQDLLEEFLAYQQSQYAAEGGGFYGADPYAPSGGFPSPPMPNGKMPQYRTQGSGFVSDGTVRDYASMALADQDRFSTDAFIQADPALKPLIARAVAEAGNDPYAAYANFEDGSYREALINMALQQSGLSDLRKEQGFDGVFKASRMDGVDADENGLVDNGESWTNEDAIAQILANTPGADKQTAHGTGFVDPLSGREFQAADTYENVLREKLGGYQGALDNFFNNAAPSTERNLMDIEGVTGALGGMPFPGRGDGGTDFSQSGPGFSGRGGGGPMSKEAWIADYLQRRTGDVGARSLTYRRGQEAAGYGVGGRRIQQGGSSGRQPSPPSRRGHASPSQVQTAADWRIAQALGRA